jgi:UPF0042 nucleotide-binding protein
MKLIIVSGLSGSGKSIALNTLEDSGYYCIDNLPFFMLENFLNESASQQGIYQKVAISIDSRNHAETDQQFPALIEHIRSLGINCSTLFLHAEAQILINRFRETRRKHPLLSDTVALGDAIEKELLMMTPIASCADIVIDSTRMNIHQLRQVIRDRIENSAPHPCSVKLESFGFKFGLPVDADFVFDVRCLPNPYWQTNLREKTGKDPSVNDFLDSSDDAQEFVDDINHLLQRWVPLFEKDNRSYLNIAIGCTGGQHRSVYVVEKIAVLLNQAARNHIIHHRELSKRGFNK